MKKIAIIISIVAVLASLVAMGIALAGIIDRRRERFESDYGSFDDEMFDEDVDFYAESLESTSEQDVIALDQDADIDRQ